MPDMCQLVIATTMTLQACFTPQKCSPSADGSKTLCTGEQPIGCPMPPPAYECKRLDGSTYWWTPPADQPPALNLDR